MTRYELEMAEKHRKILYERLESVEEWKMRCERDGVALAKEEESLKKRILQLNKTIEELKERLDD